MPTSDFTCPTCGEEVHPNAKSCPNCGTHPERWSTGGVIIDDPPDLGIPGDSYDYDDFVAREFNRDGKLRAKGPRGGLPVRRIWIITAIALLAAIAFLIVNGLW